MAKKDVLNYYLNVQSQYIEMLTNVKDLNDALKAGIIEQDDPRIEQLNMETDLIKSNYERIAYILFLLNQPARKEKKKIEHKQNKQVYDYLRASTDTVVMQENEDALSYIRQLAKELKNDN